MAKKKPANGELTLKVESWPIGRVINYAQNPRTHSPEQVSAIAASIKEFGFVNPCLVDANGVLIAGHGRVLAAHHLGRRAVPVIRLGHLTDDQARALRIADNQLGLLSAWDAELIRSEISLLKLSDYPLALLGFGEQELVQFTTTVGPPAAQSAGSLAERFGVVPFSVLNAREGWWQARKDAWIALGIQSELGRGENLLKFSETLQEPNPAKRAARKLAHAKA